MSLFIMLIVVSKRLEKGAKRFPLAGWWFLRQKASLGQVGKSVPRKRAWRFRVEKIFSSEQSPYRQMDLEVCFGRGQSVENFDLLKIWGGLWLEI